MNKTHCGGCRNDYYNEPGNACGGECWLLKSAKLVTRYKIHRDSLPYRPRAFQQVKVPQCCSSPPWFFYEALPECAGTIKNGWSTGDPALVEKYDRTHHPREEAKS